MRVRRFVLIVTFVTTLVAGPGAHADLNYRAEITGAEDSDLASLLDKVSQLRTLEDKPPASEEALRRRADSDSAGSPMPRTASATGTRISRTTSTFRQRLRK